MFVFGPKARRRALRDGDEGCAGFFSCVCVNQTMCTLCVYACAGQYVNGRALALGARQWFNVLAVRSVVPVRADGADLICIMAFGTRP